MPKVRKACKICGSGVPVSVYLVSFAGRRSARTVSPYADFNLMPAPTASTSSTHSYACVGILLAAGHGRRYAAMAPGQDKLLTVLDGGLPIAQASAAALLAATRRTVAVTREDQGVLRALLEAAGCEVLVLDGAANGMGDSLAAAARYLIDTAMPDEQACLVALADMPWLRADTCQQIALAARPAPPIVVPTWQGQRGHPVAFNRALWPELAALSGDIGARALLARHPVNMLAVDDPGVVADVDTPLDLRAAR